MWGTSSSFTRIARTLTFPALFAIGIASLGAVATAQGSNYFLVSMSGSEETPPNASTATGGGCLVLDFTAHKLLYAISFNGLSSAETAADIHCCAASGQAGPVLFSLPLGSPVSGSIVTTPAQEAQLMQGGESYVEIHSTQFPNGEIRGRLSLPPIVPPFPYCFGDGSGTACPCGNNSAVGAQAGCLNSVGTGGTLRSLGFASKACDDLTLLGAGMPNGGAALFFQGSSQINGGVGAVFGDGLRCAGGTVVRIAAVAVSGGVAQYPNAGQPSISVRTALVTTGSRNYQVWYRNAATFCQPEGFNLTNGMMLVWYP